MTREDLTFPSGPDGDLLAAWFYRPAGPGPYPTVVMAHGLGAVRGMRLDAYAERFAAAGMAALVFDYRHFGDSAGQPRQVLDIGRQREDWVSAVRFAKTHPEVDADRLAIWGSSFGGGHVLATAAREPGIAAVVAQCPFTDGLASLGAVPLRTTLKLTALGLRDLARAARGREPVTVPLAGRPGEVALMTAPDVVPGYLSLVPEGSPFRNEAGARLALRVGFDRPGRQARRITAPVLFGICEPDTVAPSGPTKKYAAQTPRAEVKVYPFGHFDIYEGEPFEQAVGDQVEFLRRHLAVEG